MTKKSKFEKYNVSTDFGEEIENVPYLLLEKAPF